MPIRVVPRRDWGAQDPEHRRFLNVPIKFVSWVYTQSRPCYNQEECTRYVQFTQNCHMKNKGWADIKHNFLVSTDGTIYEGRGWFSNVAPISEDDPYLTDNFITIARIGPSFDESPPTPAEMAARDEIIRYGVEAGYIQPNHQVTAYFQFIN